MRFLKSIKKILPAPLDLNAIRAAFRFMHIIFLTKVLNRPSRKGPLFLTWLVTYDCNLFCKFCSTHTLKKQFPQTIDRARALQIAHEIVNAKTYTVGFTGGEVLLWPFLFEVIKILKEHGILVYVVTNGLLLKEKADELIQSRVDYIVVSIDSEDPNEHDAVRHSPGLFNMLVDGIEHLKAGRTEKRPLIKSTTVLSRHNLLKVGDMIHRLKSMVDVTSVQPIVGGHSSGPHGRTDAALQSLTFQPNEKKQVEEAFKKLARDHEEFNNDYFKLIPTFWFSKETLIKEIHCWSPFLRLQILPNGDVFHCTANANYPAVGNISKRSLREIWNSPEMLRQREEIRLHKNHCICWTQDASFNAILNAVPFLNKLPLLFVRKTGRSENE